MIFYAICIGFVIWLKHHHRGKPTLQPVFVFMDALLCKWYWLFFVIFIREEISLKKKMKDLSVVWTKHQEDPHILQVVRASYKKTYYRKEPWAI